MGKILENFCYRNKSKVCCLWSSYADVPLYDLKGKENSKKLEALSTSVVLF